MLILMYWRRFFTRTYKSIMLLLVIHIHTATGFYVNHTILNEVAVNVYINGVVYLTCANVDFLKWNERQRKKKKNYLYGKCLQKFHSVSF